MPSQTKPAWILLASMEGFRKQCVIIMDSIHLQIMCQWAQ